MSASPRSAMFKSLTFRRGGRSEDVPGNAGDSHTYEDPNKSGVDASNEVSLICKIYLTFAI